MGSVRSGLWHDYDRSIWDAYQVTLPVWGTTAVQLLLGILLGCVTPQLQNIIYRVWDAIGLRLRRARYANIANHRSLTDEETTALLDTGANRPGYGSTPTASNEESGANIVLPQGSPRPRKPRSKSSQVFSYIALFVGWTLVSGLIALIPQNKLAISSSTNCAVYNLKDDHSVVERRADDLVQAGKEIRAGEYARTCYTTQSDQEPDRCNVFAKPFIPHKCVTTRCPFNDRHFCRGTYDAVNCSTGWVDASYLGVNSNKRPQFSRSSICTPLNMDAGFVDPHYDTEEGWLFDYYLGSMNNTVNPTEFTYRQRGEPFDWAIPAYLVNSYISTYYRDIDRWKPLSPHLDRANNTFLTIMFIVSARIFYAAPSEDYIFQTTAKYPDSDYFWNGDPESHPLACVDHIELRASDGTYYPRIDQEHDKVDREFDFVRAALRHSTIYDAIQARGGNALDAHGKIRAFFSAELAKNQSAVEAENLFATSLARAQYDAWDIAIGRGQEKAIEGSYTNETDQLCGLYKYRLPKTYANFNLVAYIGFALVAVVIFILGLETSVEFEDPEKRNAYGGNKLVLDRLVDSLRWSLSKVGATLNTAYSETVGKCSNTTRPRGRRGHNANNPSGTTSIQSSQSIPQRSSEGQAASTNTSRNISTGATEGSVPQDSGHTRLTQENTEDVSTDMGAQTMDRSTSPHEDQESIDIANHDPTQPAGPLDERA